MICISQDSGPSDRGSSSEFGLVRSKGTDKQTFGVNFDQKIEGFDVNRSDGLRILVLYVEGTRFGLYSRGLPRVNVRIVFSASSSVCRHLQLIRHEHKRKYVEFCMGNVLED